MQPRIITREKARLTEQGLRLCLAAVVRQDASSYRTAIGFCTFELNLNPIRLPREVVSQERRRLIKINNDDVDVAIIVEIAEGAAAAAMRGCNAGACCVHQLFKHSLPQVSENHARRLVRVLRKLFLNARLNMTGGHKQVRTAVVN